MLRSFQAMLQFQMTSNKNEGEQSMQLQEHGKIFFTRHPLGKRRLIHWSTRIPTQRPLTVSSSIFRKQTEISGEYKAPIIVMLDLIQRCFRHA